MKHYFFFLLFGVLVVISSCTKETPVGLDTSLSSDLSTASEESYEPSDDTTSTTLTLRIDGSWNISLSGFQYVYQNRVPSQWTNLSKYTMTGPCTYPVYTGSTSTIVTSTNLCGAASTLMGLSLVPHSSQVAVPSTTTAKAVRLAVFARRYKLFYPTYNFGGYTAIDGWRTVCNGTSSKKGEFTNWNSCSSMQNSTGSTLSSQPPTSAGRTAIKNFIRSQIQLDRPVMALVTINPSVPNADYAGYFVASGGVGHMVLIVGVTEQDSNNYYRVRFKDPLSNDPKTYEVNYTTFLNSMIAYPTNYNALAFKGLWGFSSYEWGNADS